MLQRAKSALSCAWGSSSEAPEKKAGWQGQAPLSPRTASEYAAIKAVLNCSKPTAEDAGRGTGGGHRDRVFQGGAARAEKMLALEMLKNPFDSTQATARAGGLDMLIHDLTYGTAREKEEAARHIGILALNKDNQVAIAQSGAIPPLIALVQGETQLQREYAAAALTSLNMNRENRLAITQAGGSQALSQLSQQGNEAERVQAAQALGQQPLLSPRFPQQAVQQQQQAMMPNTLQKASSTASTSSYNGGDGGRRNGGPLRW